jgi:polysaccharide biosynthesis transport protein
MSPRAHLARIWRRRFLVAATTLLAGLVAFGVAIRHSGTEYTGTSTLLTVSTTSSPDQVATLATGYVDTFIQPSFQDAMLAKLKLPADVSLTAQTAASSPIIYITATAPDQATAQQAARAAASEFLSDVNNSLQASRDNLINQMRNAVAADTKTTNGAIRVPAEIDMQDRINGVNADPTNDLQVLTANAGTATVKSGVKKSVGVAVVGGFIFGCLLAWLLGAASRRLSSPADLMEKARIKPLVVIPAGGGAAAELQRERQLRQLAADVALLDLPKPTVVAVTAAEPTPAGDDIAESLARYRAQHGVRTILVHADGAPTVIDTMNGEIQQVDDGWMLVSSEPQAVKHVFPIGDARNVDMLLGVEHLGELMNSLRIRADLIVIKAPAVSDSAESYMVCAVADRTLLLAGVGSSADTVAAARDRMEQVGVSLLGVVFVEGPGRPHAEPVSNGHTPASELHEPTPDVTRPSEVSRV